MISTFAVGTLTRMSVLTNPQKKLSVQSSGSQAWTNAVWQRELLACQQATNNQSTGIYVYCFQWLRPICAQPQKLGNFTEKTA